MFKLFRLALRGVFVPILFLLIINDLAFGKMNCYKDKTICVQVIENQDNDDYDYDVFAISKKANPDITLTLYMNLQNLVSSERLPATIVLRGFEKKKICSLKREIPGIKWRYSYKFSWQYGDNNAVHDDSCVYLLPYRKAETYAVSQGYNGGFTHKGDGRYAIDFATPEGTYIRAARDGVVVAVEVYSRGNGTTNEFFEKANYVVIKHDDNTLGKYYHLRTNGRMMRLGAKVRAGEIIAISGNTGYSNGPHLHFEVVKPVNGSRVITIPVKFLTDQGIVDSLQQGVFYTSVDR